VRAAFEQTARPANTAAYVGRQQEHVVPFPAPVRPAGMSEEQRIDFLAACEGRITWRMYFAKWGRIGLSL
jgi:hypothetical protein